MARDEHRGRTRRMKWPEMNPGENKEGEMARDEHRGRTRRVKWLEMNTGGEQ